MILQASFSSASVQGYPGFRLPFSKYLRWNKPRWRFDKALETDFFFPLALGFSMSRLDRGLSGIKNKKKPLEPRVVQGKHFPFSKDWRIPGKNFFFPFQKDLEGRRTFQRSLRISRLCLFVFTAVNHHQNHVVPVKWRLVDQKPRVLVSGYAFCWRLDRSNVRSKNDFDCVQLV